MAWTREDKWYSGQGVVLLAQRNVDGSPKGFEEVGNCSAVRISVTSQALDKRESRSGQRALAKRLRTETNAQMSITMDSYIASNLARALRGKVTEVTGSSVTDEASKGYVGKITSLKHIKVSTVVISKGVEALTEYPGTVGKWDYQLNAEAGSYMINPDPTKFDKLVAASDGLNGAAIDLVVDYAFADQLVVESLTESAQELYVRFEGLNTAEGNEPVVIEVFKFDTDPLRELDLISDTFQSFVLEGPVLQDTNRPDGESQFFKVTKLGTLATA